MTEESSYQSRTLNLSDRPEDQSSSDHNPQEEEADGYHEHSAEIQANSSSTHPSRPVDLSATNPLEVNFGTQLNVMEPTGDDDQIEDCISTELSQLNERRSNGVDPNANATSEPPKKVRQRLWTVVLSAVVACIPFLLVGCTLGFPSGALLDLTDLEDRPDYKLSREQADLFGALGYIGALFGGPIAGWISDRMGRKPALMLVSIPYLTGYMMLAYAHFATDPVVFKVILLIGRFFSGVGLGWSSLAVVVYVAEVSPANLRGRIGSILQVLLALGVLIIYALSISLRYNDSSLVLVGFVVLFTLSMIFFCETPQWLLSRGQEERAIAVLKFLRGPNHDIDKELEAFQASFASSPHLKIGQVFLEFTKGNVAVPVALALLLVMFLQCGGLNTIIAYSAGILMNAGVQDFRQIAVFGTAATRLVINVIAVFLTDCLGRKVLLIISSIGTFLGTTLLGVHFYITRPASCLPSANSSDVTFVDFSFENGPVSELETIFCNPQFAPLAIVAIVIYNVGFSIGWGPVIWLLLGELLPLQVRGVGNGIATFAMWSFTAIVVGTYFSYSDAVQPWFVWWTYSVVNLLSIFFIVFCLFETKGKSLEDIQRRFQTKYGKYRLSCPTGTRSSRL